MSKLRACEVCRFCTRVQLGQFLPSAVQSSSRGRLSDPALSFPKGQLSQLRLYLRRPRPRPRLRIILPSIRASIDVLWLEESLSTSSNLTVHGADGTGTLYGKTVSAATAAVILVLVLLLPCVGMQRPDRLAQSPGLPYILRLNLATNLTTALTSD
jgi:hypothetical protein